VPDGGECVPGRYRAVDRPGISLSVGTEIFRLTLDPGTVRAHETLVIDASIVRLPDAVDPDTGNELTQRMQATVDAEVARGPVPACEVVPTS
jgi:hypothetical protein